MTKLKLIIDDYNDNCNISDLPDDLFFVKKEPVSGYLVCIERLPEGYKYYDDNDPNESRYFNMNNILGSYTLWDKYDYVGNYDEKIPYEEYRYLARKGEGLI